MKSVLEFYSTFQPDYDYYDYKNSNALILFIVTNNTKITFTILG